MSEIKKQLFKIKDICDIANSDKTITRISARKNEGIYPVYAATIATPFAYINFYNNDKVCLVVVNDGASGSTYIVSDEKYTLGKHVTGLIPHEGIDIRYLQYISEPVFKNIAKGYGVGNLPKMDILNTEVAIPINKNGTFDLCTQEELANKYRVIEDNKMNLITKSSVLKQISVSFSEDSSIKWAYPLVTDLFYPQGGNAEFTKAWVSKNRGDIPLYSGTTTGEYARINKAEYNGEYLTWCIDGLAGYIMYHNEAFSLTCHRGVLLPTDKCKNIDLKYIKYILEPIFRKRKKGREGDMGKNEYTSLKPIAIKRMVDTIPVPVKEDGTYDMQKQKELAEKYEQIDGIKNSLFQKILELTEIVVL
ncbi:MAG: restriction endonuclease subunit S [Lachnospiraceae bacterium]|nr:restriction endonuclease subunit S [Lachnospiraceae bacterium]